MYVHEHKIFVNSLLLSPGPHLPNQIVEGGSTPTFDYHTPPPPHFLTPPQSNSPTLYLPNQNYHPPHPPSPQPPPPYTSCIILTSISIILIVHALLFSPCLHNKTR